MWSLLMTWTSKTIPQIVTTSPKAHSIPFISTQFQVSESLLIFATIFTLSWHTHADAKNNFASQMYESAQTNNALSRLGLDKVTLIDKNKNSGFSSKRDDFKIFHDIPSSSHLLMNYDPFYSPLLSRLDSVFQQLGLGMVSDERCREKLVCLMYSNPAKYAPYSNLVSAQLSRWVVEIILMPFTHSHKLIIILNCRLSRMIFLSRVPNRHWNKVWQFKEFCSSESFFWAFFLLFLVS